MSLAERRQKLIEAALSVIARQGLASATTRAIASEAGMPLASFHYAFESHQVLLAEATRILMARELERIGSVPVEGETKPDVVRTVLASQLQAVHEDPQHFQSLAELIHHAYRTDGQRDLVRRWHRDREALVAQRIAEHAQQAGLELVGEPTLVARSLLTMADGLTGGILANDDVAAGQDAIETWLRAAA